MSWITELFGVEKPIIGMVHLRALPGTPLYDEEGGIAGIVEAARGDLEALRRGGVDAVMFCNENDRPYSLQVGPEVVAAMASAVSELSRGLDRPFGVDILWDPIATIAVGHATGAHFAREVFTGAYAGDMGVWSTNAARALRFRREIGAESLRLLFNVVPEFAIPISPRPSEQVAKTAVFSSLADAVCVSGFMAGADVPLEELRRAKAVLTDTPVIANTGVRLENVAEILHVADGAVVGTSFKIGRTTFNPVDEGNVVELMAAVRDVRASLARH